MTHADDDTPEARLARWTERDAAIGLAARDRAARARSSLTATGRSRTSASGARSSAQRVAAADVERVRLEHARRQPAGRARSTGERARHGAAVIAGAPARDGRDVRSADGDGLSAAHRSPRLRRRPEHRRERRGRAAQQRVFVVEAVRSVLATAGVPVEVIVVAGRGDAGRGGRRSSSALDGDVRLVDYDAAVQLLRHRQPRRRARRGEHLLLLNDDTEAIVAGWLVSMLDALATPVDGRPVGAVGAKLLFEDGTLQHAGHTYRTSLDHVGFGLPGDARGTRRDPRPSAPGRGRHRGLHAHAVRRVRRGRRLLDGVPRQLQRRRLLHEAARSRAASIVYEPAAVLTTSSPARASPASCPTRSS